MPFKPIKKTNNYFISSAGYVFKIENGKEIVCKPTRTPISGEVQVFINNKAYNLLYLMIEYFKGDIFQNQSFRFKVDKDLRIPEGSIIIRTALGKNGLSPKEESDMMLYKCHIKASSANGRHHQKVSPIDIYKSLLLHDFKCVYCGRPIHPNNWHLDHFNSLHKGGQNIFENIVPSCPVCNTMKGSLEGHQFYKRCKTIVENYLFKNNVSPNAYLIK